jgi:hypothetical protein
MQERHGFREASTDVAIICQIPVKNQTPETLERVRLKVLPEQLKHEGDRDLVGEFDAPC